MNLEKYLKSIMNPAKYVKDRFNVTTSADYFALAVENRETKKWFWPFGGWYLSPYAMAMGDLFHDEGGLSEWEIWHKEIDKRYPVQSFFREYDRWDSYRKYRLVYNIFRENIYYPVQCFFSPRNKKIAKQIPNIYKNPSAIIEDVLFAVFLEDTSYSSTEKMNESEINIENGITEEYLKEHNDRVDLCDKVRKWIKIDRIELRKKIEQEWGNIPKGKDLTYEQKYGTINGLEKELLDTDTKYLKWIIEQREYYN